MSYCIDLSTISLETYKEKLQDGDLLPSRKALLHSIDDVFGQLSLSGVENLQQLQQHLKTKKRIQQFAFDNSIKEEYLTLLNRELNSNVAKPPKLREFIAISLDTLLNLETHAIKDAKQFYEATSTTTDRDIMAKNYSISIDEISMISSLCDLTRVRYVNHTFSYVLYKAGITSVDQMKSCDYEKLYETVVEVNNRENIYKGNIGRNDMRLCIKYANELESK